MGFVSVARCSWFIVAGKKNMCVVTYMWFCSSRVDVIVSRRNHVTVVCAFINHSVLTSVLKAVVLFALPLNSILFFIVCVCFSILVASTV